MLAVSSFYISSVGILPSLEVVGRLDKVNWSSLIPPTGPDTRTGKDFYGNEKILFAKKIVLIIQIFSQLLVQFNFLNRFFLICFGSIFHVKYILHILEILISLAELCSCSRQAECVEFHWFSDPDDCESQDQGPVWAESNRVHPVPPLSPSQQSYIKPTKDLFQIRIIDQF